MGGSRSRSSFFSHYTGEQEEEEHKEHPYDAVFGKDMYKKMHDKRDYVEKMNL